MSDVTKKTIKIARTKTGVPCLWESLMNFSDLKRSTVILDNKGKSKPAVYCNETRDKQALVPIQVGDYISKSFQDQHGIAISVFIVEDISPMENTAVITPVYRKSSLEEGVTTPGEYKNMVDYSVKKLRGELGIISSHKNKLETV
jgi:hypothetical protein